MDVIGPIEPPALNGHRFILVAIDYFIKWVEALTCKVVTKKVVVDFIRNNIVCRFGIPQSIIIDNAANLNSDLMRETCEKFRIAHRNSTAYRPQMNGAVEAANKNIKKILRKIIDSQRQWHEKLPYALLGYRTTARTSTGATPYMLDEAKGKFAPNWQGPYVVHRVLSGGALILGEMDGKVSTKPINSDLIKKYYI
ncbi:uncharacterized protein LOC132045014 [Lycium ferocissimum]|uniref:uncharacterized protein LOC132045014 n=1 Tax=Lycium ferocissimum TaxID=112874 RepID=UPI00281626CD|nr:uncharacterized protein LOC132045014 [Lycium ferocissimum]